MEFDPDAPDPELVPRIRPTERWLRAVEGLWEMDGERFWVGEDAETGTLRAVAQDGEAVNPIPIISRGRRISRF